MAGLSPKLPLMVGGEYGVYETNKTFLEMIKQNFKNLLLTIPGERVMDPNFGVGLLKFLFEPDTGNVRGSIVDDVDRQLKIYMPFVEIVDISFAGEAEGTEPGQLNMKIRYKITPLGAIDFLEITVT